VDVTERCSLLVKNRGKTLNALRGVAYTEKQRNFRFLKYPEVVPNLWQVYSEVKRLTLNLGIYVPLL